MVNILYLHGSAELYGSDNVLYEILKGLDRTRYKPFVILPLEGPLIDKIRDLEIEVMVYPYPVMRRQYFTPHGIIKFALQFISAHRWLKKYCREHNIKIIHSNTLAVSEGLVLSRKEGIHHVWHVHEIVSHPALISKLYSFLIRLGHSHIVTVSKAVRDFWFHSSRKQRSVVTVIHNCINSDQFRPDLETDYLKKEFGIKPGEMVIGMIGRVNAIKGQHVFVEALENVMKEEPGVKALLVGGVFAGQEWRMETLKNTIASSGFKSRFIVEDFRNDIANIHCLIDILVFPSVQAEAFGLVVVEAMASGKPVVCFKNGGVTEIVEEGINGFYAEQGNPRSLAEKIRILIKDKDLRQQIGLNNIEKQRTSFSDCSFHKRINDLYQSLEEGKG